MALSAAAQRPNLLFAIPVTVASRNCCTGTQNPLRVLESLRKRALTRPQIDVRTKKPGRAELLRVSLMRKEGLEPSHPIWEQEPETCASTISPLSLKPVVLTTTPRLIRTNIPSRKHFFEASSFFLQCRSRTSCAHGSPLLHTRRMRVYGRYAPIRRAPFFCIKGP